MCFITWHHSLLRRGYCSQPSDTLAHHKLKVAVHGLMIFFEFGILYFGSDTNDLLIRTDQKVCLIPIVGIKFIDPTRKISDFKDESVVTVEELESFQVTPARVHHNFSGLLDCFRQHEVLHCLITLLLSALAVAPNEVVTNTLTIIIVLKSCKPKVSSPLTDELFPHGFVWKLNSPRFVIISRPLNTLGESEVVQVDL